MSATRRRQLLDLAARHDLLIIEDDYEFEMNFLVAPTPAFQRHRTRMGALSMLVACQNQFFLDSGLAVVAPKFDTTGAGLRHLILRHPPGHAQRTLAYFMALGHYDAQFVGCAGTLAERRRVLQSAIDAEGLFSHSAAHFGGTSFGSVDLNGLTREFWQREP